MLYINSISIKFKSIIFNKYYLKCIVLDIYNALGFVEILEVFSQKELFDV